MTMKDSLIAQVMIDNLQLDSDEQTVCSKPHTDRLLNIKVEMDKDIEEAYNFYHVDLRLSKIELVIDDYFIKIFSDFVDSISDAFETDLIGVHEVLTPQRFE